MATKTKKGRIVNSPLIGLLLLVFLNVTSIVFIMNVSRYISVQKSTFTTALLVLLGLIVMANIFFAIGYGLRYKFSRYLYLGVSFVLILGLSVGTFYIVRLNKSLDAFVDKDSTEVTDYSFITVKEGQTLDNLFAETTLGYVAKDTDYNEKVEVEVGKHSSNVKIVVFETYQKLFESLLIDEDLDVAVVPKQYMRYVETFDDSYQAILDEATVLRSFNVKSSVDVSTNANVLKEPFTVLMMGLNDNLADSIILLSVNPQTLHVTMTSVARDLYVPIACYSGNRADKLNHSRGRSRQCMVDTIEDLFEIDVDFIFEADFFAMIKIVEALGGLELEVPHTFGRMLPIEGSHKREWIEVPAGKNVLNGKQVLNFARERKTFPRGDFQRQLNQQYIIKELSMKIINESKKNIETFMRVIRSAEKNISMTFSVEKDLSPLIGFAISNMAASPVDPMSTFVIENSQITGITPKVNGMSVIVPYTKSLADNKKIIHDNLSTTIQKPRQERFVFNANSNQKYGIDTSPGKYYGGAVSWPKGASQEEPNTPVEETPSTPNEANQFKVPNLISLGVEGAKSWGAKNGVTISIRKIGPEHEDYNNFVHNQIINQTVPEGDYNTKPAEITISVVDKQEAALPTVPDFASIKEAKAWGTKNNVTIILDQELTSDQYDSYTVISQWVKYDDQKTKILSVSLKVKQKEVTEG